MSGLDGNFILTNVNHPVVESDDERQWTLSASDQEAPMATLAPIAACTVYVFRSVEGAQTEFVSEYVADAAGTLSESTADERKEHETRRNTGLTQDRVPAATELNSLFLSFPHDINGKAAQYFFFATEDRLSFAGIEYIAANKPDAIPWVNVQAKNACYVDDKGTRYLPVINPLFVAFQLNARFEEAANHLLNITTLHSDLSDSERAIFETDQAILMVARILKGVLDHPDGSKFASCFGDGTGNNVRAHLDTRTQEVNARLPVEMSVGRHWFGSCGPS